MQAFAKFPRKTAEQALVRDQNRRLTLCLSNELVCQITKSNTSNLSRVHKCGKCLQASESSSLWWRQFRKCIYLWRFFQLGQNRRCQKSIMKTFCHYQSCLKCIVLLYSYLHRTIALNLSLSCNEKRFQHRKRVCKEVANIVHQRRFTKRRDDDGVVLYQSSFRYTYWHGELNSSYWLTYEINYPRKTTSIISVLNRLQRL